MSTWREYLDDKVASALNSRSLEQFVGIVKWAEAMFRGYIEAAPGFGKTRIGLEAIKMIHRNGQDRSVLVIVPTLLLFKQWNKDIKEWGLQNVKVMVVNSAVKIQHDVYFLILDEAHRIPAETFKQIFPRTKYKIMLGLTATLRRLDNKHTLLHEYGPTVHTVPLEKCRQQGWVARFIEFNVPIREDEEWHNQYDSHETTYARCISRFGHDFKLMQSCGYSIDPKHDEHYPAAVVLARQLGWRGNSPARARQLRVLKVPLGSAWGNPEHPKAPQKLQTTAGIGMRASQAMGSLIYTSPKKTDAAIQICAQFPELKTITFGQRTDVADAIAEATGGGAYHTKIASTTVPDMKFKHYKTQRGMLKWLEKHSNWSHIPEGGDFTVGCWYDRVVRASEVKEQNVQKFLDSELNPMCTARAFDEGVDIPDARLGIVHSRSSSGATQTQRAGRIARYFVYPDGTSKLSFLVNLYIPDSKDERWLIKAQTTHRNIEKVELNELYERINDEIAGRSSSDQVVQDVQPVHQRGGTSWIDFGSIVSAGSSEE